MINELKLTYSGFNVSLCNAVGQQEKYWQVGDYEKTNYFASYYYKGSIVEYRLNTDEIVSQHHNEHFYNGDLRLSFPTYEIYKDSTWLCFSSFSWKIKAEYLLLDGSVIIPPHTGTFNLLGSFNFISGTAKALNYIKPRPYPIEIMGKAKILLLTGTN
jgi:hypothetical protein